ncbi:MAG: peptide deformylase [Bacteroidales bacterium]
MHRRIIAYGHTILRKECKEINEGSKKIHEVEDDLWETLEKSGGVGLAAPQINSSLKAFVVNTRLMYNNLSNNERKEYFALGDEGIIETFLNAEIIERSEHTWNEYEACLSIPGVYEPVNRSWIITVEYQNKDLKHKRKKFSGYTAKVIQHEFDHTKGILIIDYLHPLKKQMIKNKLKRILDGRAETTYPIKFTTRRKK